MRNILVTIPVTEEELSRLKAACPDGVFTLIPKEKLDAKAVKDKEIIIGNIPKELVPECGKLRLLELNMAGTDGYPELMPEGAVLVNSSGAYGLAISEHMLGMLLAIKKKLYLYYDNQHDSLWRDEGGVTSIEDAYVLSVGMGDIGGEFTRKCKALGAYTVGIRRNVREKPDYADEMHTLDELDLLLPLADVVALSLPSGAATRGLMDERRLRMMKKGAVLINVGRGNAIVTDDLVRVLNDGHIYAALDVVDPEPLPAEHPLWKAPNVFITPHISGFFHLRQTLERIIAIAEENLKRFSSGEPLLNVVDSKTGYRGCENRA
ncbi:MAG: D-2-hydroxyacid dehydrogenase [Clostridiales bacterium]|nr:D-2-hydroxyacid dehydrogenase [Clostridiales bacterium]